MRKFINSLKNSLKLMYIAEGSWKKGLNNAMAKL